MHPADISATTGAILGIVAVLGVIVGWLKWLRPRWRRFKNDALGARDALVGRDAIIDRASGREVAPAIPGIGTRMATVEQALVTLVDNEHRLSALESETVEIKADVAELKAAAMERVASKIESIAAYDAMQRALDAQPDHIDVESDES